MVAKTKEEETLLKRRSGGPGGGPGGPKGQAAKEGAQANGRGA